MHIMIQTMVGKKLTMTHTYDDQGRWMPVTRLSLGPCVVTQIRTAETDGYQAVQLAYGSLRTMTNPMKGHLVKANLTAMPQFMIEVQDGEEGRKIGDRISVSDIFSAGDTVKVTGLTRGRGFTGVVKRWGFHGGPKTHGQSDRHRAPGAIGQGTTPGRVHKGKKMAGRHGHEQKSIMNLNVVKVDPDKNELWVNGAVPGYPSSKVIVTVLKSSKEEGN